MNEKDKEFLDKYAEIGFVNNTIDKELYNNYNVKRGLRNKDGTGVLAGLTEIGDVHGYILDESERVPVHGRLRYRGISLTDIVAGFQNDHRYGFEEVCYLLLFGQLPNEAQLKEFTATLGRKRFLPETFTEDMILKAPSNNIMNKLARSILAFYSYDDDPENMDFSNVLMQSIDLIALLPTMAAYAYQAKRHYFDRESLYIHAPNPDLSTAENFLSMIRPDKVYTETEARLLDLCLVLHAEHGGGNNSAFTVHVISSSHTDTYSAISGAVGSLKGARHGGANIKVHGMMENIEQNITDINDKDQIAAYLEKILKKEAHDGSGLIYGLGHAVYTLSDPRAVLLRKQASQLAEEKGFSKKFAFYTMVEELAPEIFHKVKGNGKEISANVDFYSGLVYEMLNIPYDLFTPLFAISRIAGWTAHRLEEIVQNQRIMRPAYKSVRKRDKYKTLDNR